MFKTSSILLFVAACLLSTCAAFDFNDIEIDTKVVQGENATRGQFPFYVLLKVKMAQGTAACGGSLISNEYVVTVSNFQYFGVTEYEPDVRLALNLRISKGNP